MIKPLELVSNCQKSQEKGLSFCFLSPILELYAGWVYAWVWLDGDYLSCPETFGACKLIKCVNMSKGSSFPSHYLPPPIWPRWCWFRITPLIAFDFRASKKLFSLSSNWLLKTSRGGFPQSSEVACKFFHFKIRVLSSCHWFGFSILD